jgi:putative transposase
LIEAFQYCIQAKGMELYGFIILFNEVKVIMRSTKKDLSGLLRDYKKHTANTLLEMIPTSKDPRAKWIMKRMEWAGKATSTNEIYNPIAIGWKKGNQPQEILSAIELYEALVAIHQLPVDSEIVYKEIDYIHSSVHYYKNKDGVLQLKILPPVQTLFDNNNSLG